MIDLHCHILPGIDDGPPTIDEALQMCRIAVQDGITSIVATPHMRKGVYSTNKTQILKAVQSLQSDLKKNNIDVAILPGHEAYISETLLRDIDTGQVLTINDAMKYMSLEMPHDSVPFYIEDVLKELKGINIIGIISHPERNFQIRQDWRILKKIVKLGALSQITAMSITGEFGEGVKKTAVTLLKKGLVHMVVSDAHSADKRMPILSKAVQETARIIGEKKALAMVNCKEVIQRVQNLDTLTVS
ncbi:MAG: hypothetical protein KKH94_08630 [Candidatus Omnitrophica bacterium]|nr:hypothetical protein [Candidatus Omnitrophota bacterium]